MSSHAHSRARITAGELVVVCSHYDLGVIEEVRRFRGGSRLAPKVLIVTDTGEYLLKRRAPGPSNEPTKVAFTHEVILHLAERGFPVPPLMGTKGSAVGGSMCGGAGGGGNSMLQLGPASPGGGGVYEVFKFVRGVRFDRTPEAARAAGASLAACHECLSDLKPLFPAPRRTFHNHPQVPDRLMSISGTLNDPGVRGVCRALADAYIFASEQAERVAPSGRHAASDAEGRAHERPQEQIVHGDWHPGNMLFAPPAGENTPGTRRRQVSAVFDFDSARMGLPLHDLANGAMQFSVLRHMGQSASDEEGGGAAIPPSSWRIALIPDLFAAFCAGYLEEEGERRSGLEAWRQQSAHPATPRPHAAPSPAPATSIPRVNPDSLRAVPWLMIEALIVEAGVPIAATGKFGKLDAKPVLGVVHRAVEAMAAGAEKLVALAGGR